MNKLLVPLVGAHYNPPAKQLLAGLPAGVALQLRPEPDNPYDENAVLVVLRTEDIPKESYGRLNVELDGTQGSDLNDVLAESEMVLGHCAATGGKPLAKLQAGCGDKLSGTLEVGEAWKDAGGMLEAKLCFLPDGSPAVEVSA